jgi:tetratricopeptide (TPR) repeat protein
MLYPHLAAVMVLSNESSSHGATMPSLFSSSRWLLLVVGTCLSVGCQKKTRDPDSADPAPAIKHTGPPVTEDECKEFAKKLEKAVADGNKAEFDKLIRVVGLLERSISDLDLTANEKKRIISGASVVSGQISEQIMKPVKDGGSYSVLRARVVDGRPRVLMRLITHEGTVNYHEFTLARYPDGQIVTEDIYDYSVGEPATQTFRRLMLGYIAEKNQGVIDKLTGSERLLTKHREDLAKMAQQVSNGQYKEAFATFHKLPAELQKNKIVRIVGMQAAQGADDDDEYLAQMEQFRKEHPNDPASDLLSLDYFSLKKEYPELLKAVEQLDKNLGGDPYLMAFRANVLLEMKKYKEAREAAEKAIKDDPKLDLGYLVRAGISAQEKNHKDALVWLKKLVEATGTEPDLDMDERFADFVKSPQFQDLNKWLEERNK